MPGERTVSPEPTGGSPPSGPDRAMLDAAQGVLTTLSAGRAALLQLAASHLPFDRLLALHRHASSDAESLDGAGSVVDRRIALHMRALRSRDLPALSAPAVRARPPAPPPVAPAPPPAAPAPPPVAPAAASPEAPVKRAATPRGGPERIARSLLADRSARAPALPPADTTTAALRDLAVAAAARAATPVVLIATKPPAATNAAVELSPIALRAEFVGDEPSYVGPFEEVALEPADAAAPEEAPPTDAGPFVADDAPASLAALFANDAPAEPPAAPVPDAPPPRLHDALSDWAAAALGGADADAPHEHSVPDMDAAALPKLREPRVPGTSVAMLNVRAAGTAPAPRAAGLESIEANDGDDDWYQEDDDPAEEATGAGAGMSVTFESHAPVRAQRSAPRLTEDDPADATQSAPAAFRAPAAPDEKVVQQLLDAANAHARKGEFHKAIQLYTDALDMRHTLVEAHIGRGRCHLELGDYSSAMSDFARAEDHAPDRPDAHVAMGDLYFARKEYKRAIEFYDQAVEIDGSHAMARCRRGISHYYRKNFRQACQDLQRALALDPEIPNIRKYVQMAQKKLEKGE
jgi:Flp pilus assembly protein TadD